jgi:type IV secretion system protein VirB4
MLSLRPFKSKEPGVNDLLNWAALIDSGIVQNKDGSLLAGYFYRGPDVASSTADERNALCVRINAALTRLSGGWAIWVDAAHTDAAGYPEAAASDFPDDVSRMIDDERRVQFEAAGQLFESDYAIVLQFTPPLRRNSRILDSIYDETDTHRHDPSWQILSQFAKDLAQIEDAIGNSVTLRRMQSFIIAEDDHTFLSDELVNYLHYCLNNEIIALKIPSTGGYLDTIIGLKGLWTGETPLYGDEYIAAVAIQGFPEESFPQILDSLDHLEIPYRWSTRFIFLDQHEAIHELHKYHRKWKQRVRGFFSQLFKTQGGTINEDAALMTQQAQSALTVAHSGLATYGFHTPVVLLRHSDPDILKDRARLVSRAIDRLGFSARVEDLNTMEAWLGSLPGHPIPNVRRPPDHTDNLSNLLPLASVWAGSPVHPNPLYPPHSPSLFVATAIGSAPFRCSLHYSDIGHVLMVGPIGSGKSTNLAMFAASFLRYPGATVCVLDKGRSMKTLCQAVGGIHNEIAGDGTPSFCPLAELDTETDRAETGDLIAVCFELQHRRPPLPHHTDAIHRALMLMAEGSDRSITHFIATVQDQDVREAMHYYSLAGPMGHLYDAERDGLATHHFVVHEIGELMALDDKSSIPAILHIFRKFRRQLKGQPALLIVDEAWLAFSSELMSAKLREALKEFRKLCCGVLMATQSLSDAVRSQLFPVLVESCAYKIYLPNPDAGVEGTQTNPGPHDMYLALGLNDVEIDIVRYATPKREMYIKCPEGRRLVALDLGPVARALCGVSDPKDLAVVADLQRRYGAPGWVEEWISYRNRKQPIAPLMEAAE